MSPVALLEKFEWSVGVSFSFSVSENRIVSVSICCSIDCRRWEVFQFFGRSKISKQADFQFASMTENHWIEKLRRLVGKERPRHHFAPINFRKTRESLVFISICFRLRSTRKSNYFANFGRLKSPQLIKHHFRKSADSWKLENRKWKWNFHTEVSLE